MAKLTPEERRSVARRTVGSAAVLGGLTVLSRRFGWQVRRMASLARVSRQARQAFREFEAAALAAGRSDIAAHWRGLRKANLQSLTQLRTLMRSLRNAQHRVLTARAAAAGGSVGFIFFPVALDAGLRRKRAREGTASRPVVVIVRRRASS